ncbi:alpha/beta-hydrolase [Dendrothele bispora CBS 962.96]|uniref:Alpha/beta-hydrolase n=1 Tax=Dendrothele bispora (strain CBS 962.96) TaxID=1314807 RepID=A0A4S8LQ19_DENBC|nr:alpha/beta-hydrolase [Dendrothele bispora CBS 962.96]
MAQLAGPPGDCCFSKGVKFEGTPVGKVVTIAGAETYISEPQTSSNASSGGGKKKVILFLPDVHGPFFDNTKLVQDYFAENGFYVVGIDYFFGDIVDAHDNEPGFDRQAWMKKSQVQAAEVLPKWYEAVKEMYGTCADANYCSVGYCFGAPYVLEWTTTGEIVAGAFAHPAFLNEDHFRGVKRPLLMSCAETDHTFPLPARRRAEDLLIEAKAQYHIQVFSGVAHGFALRGDPNIPDTRWAKEECASCVVRWFNRFINESSK